VPPFVLYADGHQWASALAREIHFETGLVARIGKRPTEFRSYFDARLDGADRVANGHAGGVSRSFSEFAQRRWMARRWVRKLGAGSAGMVAEGDFKSSESSTGVIGAWAYVMIFPAADFAYLFFMLANPRGLRVPGTRVRWFSVRSLDLRRDGFARKRCVPLLPLNACADPRVMATKVSRSGAIDWPRSHGHSAAFDLFGSVGPFTRSSRRCCSRSNSLFAADLYRLRRTRIGMVAAFVFAFLLN